jgi:formate hydrogenlyase subunit 4
MSRDFPSLLAATFVVAEAADAFSALVVSRELNPIIGAAPPVVSVALKVALVCFVLAVVQVIRSERPLVARLVLVVGVVAGIVGTISNTHLTPFHG